MSSDNVARFLSKDERELNVPPEGERMNIVVPENVAQSSIHSLPPVYHIAAQDSISSTASTEFKRGVTTGSAKSADGSRGAFLPGVVPATQPHLNSQEEAITSLPPVFLVDPPESTYNTAVGSNKIAGFNSNSSKSLKPTSDETSSGTRNAEARREPTISTASLDSSPSHFGGATVAVAARVASLPSFVDFDDEDLNGQLEDRVRQRAYEIAVNVLDEIRQNAVHAHEVTGTTSMAETRDSVTAAVYPTEPDQLAEKQLGSSSLQQRRIQLLLGLVAILVAGVIALGTLLATRNDSTCKAAPVRLSQNSSERPFSNCSFCAGGAQSKYDVTELKGLQLLKSRPSPSCADLYVYMQNLSSTDSSCPTLQAWTFLVCFCDTVPPRPTNAVCNACPNGATAIGDTDCHDVDTAVTIIASSSLYYFEKCTSFTTQLLTDRASCQCPNPRSLNLF